MVNSRDVFVDTRNIIEKAESLGSIKMFLRSLKRIGLEGRLRDTGPYTVFAPDDRAFTRLPVALQNDLMNDRDRLEGLVKYHVVPQRITTREIRDGREALTLSGKTLIFHSGLAFTVNDLIIVQPDIECINGVIHIIDSLLDTKENY